MSVSLVKGQKVSLTKDYPDLREVFCGLGWDQAEGGRSSIDCDASVFLLRGNLKKDSDIVSFRNLKHKSKSVIHHGDNLTGAGEGDDEVVDVYLDKIPKDVTKLVFVVNIYQGVARHQTFDMINNAFIRLVNRKTGEELYRYELSDNYSGCYSVIFGELYRHGSEWKFNPMGTGCKESSINELARLYA